MKRTRKPMSKETRIEVYKKFNGICLYCLKNLSTEKFVVDHGIALCRGGKNEMENYFLSCRPCNSSKGAMTPSEMKLYMEGKILKGIAKKVGVSYRKREKVFKYMSFYKHNWPAKWPFEKNEPQSI